MMKLSMRSINVNHQIEGLKKTTQPDHRQNTNTPTTQFLLSLSKVNQLKNVSKL